MALDRGTLARIDRRVLAELGNETATQTVKVPLSDAVWSTWRRYCEAVGLTMGQGIVGLIEHELRTSIDETAGGGGQVFAGRAEQRMVAREAQAIREREIEAHEEGVRGREKSLRTRERQLRALEFRTRSAVSQTRRPAGRRARVGRNERCAPASRASSTSTARVWPIGPAGRAGPLRLGSERGPSGDG